MRRGSVDPATILRLGLPRSAKASPLHGCVGAELYNHEVRSRDEVFIVEFLLAGEGSVAHGLLLGSTAHEDLHDVEALLGLELLELKTQIVETV